MSKQKQLERFLSTLRDNGDDFISSGSKKTDHTFICSVIKQQGYWAGNVTRYFFDADFNLLRTEERKFGQ